MIARELSLIERVDWRVLWGVAGALLVFAPFAALWLVFARLTTKIETLRGPLGCLLILALFVLYVLGLRTFRRPHATAGGHA